MVSCMWGEELTLHDTNTYNFSNQILCKLS